MGRRRSMPIAYIFVENEDGSIHVQNGSCEIMGKKEMLDIIGGMFKFIENDITEDDIERHNIEALIERYDSMDKNWRRTQPQVLDEINKRKSKLNKK